MNELTHIDLFSGIGGFALAAQWAGFRTVCFSEIAPYASAVLRKHWPDVPNLGDITKADFSPYAGATVLTGGFPCQPFSCAGKQRGKEDDRFLWPRMLEVIAGVQPTWIVGENVTGFSQMVQFDRGLEVDAQGAAVGTIGTVVDRMGRGIADEALGQLEQFGYTVQAFVIPACAVDARHRRDRIWIVANRMHKRTGRREQQQEGRESEGHVADAESLRPQAGGVEVGREQGQSEPWCDGETVSDTAEEQRDGRLSQRERRRKESSDPCRWPAEPGVGRVAHGLPRRVDRIKGLGNAIVPQVAFQILRGIAQIERMK